MGLVLTFVAHAQPWLSLDSHTTYAALGDSISARYGNLPATQAFPYQIYQSGAIDNLGHTLFCNLAVPGAMTSDVLIHQLPQLGRFLHDTGMPYPQVITLQIGANDLFEVMYGADPVSVLTGIGTNLYAILTRLTVDFPNARIYVGNYFDPRLPVPGEKALVAAMNQVIANVVAAFAGRSVKLVDVYTAFEARNGLLLIEKRRADQFQAHPTNAGQNVIADVFARSIREK
jgi:lysophospholipase L1-like esterase